MTFVRNKRHYYTFVMTKHQRSITPNTTQYYQLTAKTARMILCKMIAHKSTTVFSDTTSQHTQQYFVRTVHMDYLENHFLSFFLIALVYGQHISFFIFFYVLQQICKAIAIFIESGNMSHLDRQHSFYTFSLLECLSDYCK